MPKKLTIGKIRGLQQISDANGIFAMCAMDHRGTMKRLINPAAPESVTYEELAAVKCELAEILAPVSTGILLDPLFGAAPAIARGALLGRTGLLVCLEGSGYESSSIVRVTSLLTHWNVEKIQRMGASAVKLLLFYHPGSQDLAEQQRSVTRRVAKNCQRVDIPFLLEPIAYPMNDEERDPPLFASHKPNLVIQSALDLSPLGIDVLKAEFPADMRFERDPEKLRAACEKLDGAAQTPWVLLSAGDTFENFELQVKIACQAGASGFLGGRAIWSEGLKIRDARERSKWLKRTAASRIRRLREIAGEHASPWWKRWGNAVTDVSEIGPNWYREY